MDPITRDVTLVPPTDIYGDIAFEYTIEDKGINESIDGTRTEAQLARQSVVVLPFRCNRSTTFPWLRTVKYVSLKRADVERFTFSAIDLINPTLVGPQVSVDGPGPCAKYSTRQNG